MNKPFHSLNFFGEINYFKELPTPDQISNYDQYQEPDYILEQNESINIQV